MATKNQNGVKWTFKKSYKRLKRHQIGKLLIIFYPKYISNHLNTTEKIQDGVKIKKNYAKNLKIYIIFAAKWPIFNEF
jgi:hypothetical protein